MNKIVVKPLPVIKHVSPIYRDGWISAMICGKSGCGKTALMTEIIPGISKSIKCICIATMVVGNPFHEAIREWALSNGIGFYISSNPGYIDAFVEKLRSTGFLVPGVRELLLIFDDFSANKRGDSARENLVVRAFTKWRNYGINVIVVCQDATMIATSARNCTNMRVLFGSGSIDAIRAFVKDVRPRVPDQRIIDNLLRYINSKKYYYLMVRDNPFELTLGKGTDMRTVVTEESVRIPTYKEIVSEMGVQDKKGGSLRKEAIEMQKDMGNDADELGVKLGLDD